MNCFIVLWLLLGADLDFNLIGERVEKLEAATVQHEQRIESLETKVAEIVDTKSVKLSQPPAPPVADHPPADLPLTVSQASPAVEQFEQVLVDDGNGWQHYEWRRTVQGKPVIGFTKEQAVKEEKRVEAVEQAKQSYQVRAAQVQSSCANGQCYQPKQRRGLFGRRK